MYHVRVPSGKQFYSKMSCIFFQAANLDSTHLPNPKALMAVIFELVPIFVFTSCSTRLDFSGGVSTLGLAAAELWGWSDPE